ncbi:MAG: outer membrane protein assembly factor [Gemmatimonadota bacterium]|nr:outer membrane protein assembly factor [Gemmatimonadota bacterium]MDH5196201.1 outer membrane protein assembly factor [Gemmatimonadota bacterium]
MALGLAITTLTPALAVAQDTTGAGPLSVTRASRKLRFTGFPYVFSTPEAGVALGLGGIVTFYTSTTDTALRPSKVTTSGWYSFNDQYKLSLIPQIYLDGNRWQLGLPADYGRFTDRFWGIGNQTQEFADDTTEGAPSEKYRMSALNVKLDVQFPSGILQATRAGIAVEYNDTRILDVRQNPLIDSTLLGSQGGQTLGAGFSLVWDTRNHSFFPSAGGLYQAKALAYPLVLVADYRYTRLEVDFRQYLGRGRGALALQAFGNFVFGKPPFYALSALGGSSRMRGYFQGRYRDRHYIMAQAEYRQMVWWRLGFAAFAGVGDVFGSDSSEFRIKNLKWSLGGGLRVAFNQAEKVNLRVDFGFGKKTSGVYFQLEEAF